jgi:hypothetical protein
MLIERLGSDPTRSPDDRMVEFDGGLGADALRLFFSTNPSRPGALRQEDEDLNGIPDDAQRIVGLIREAHAEIVRTLEQNGMPVVPFGSPGLPLNVEITDLPGDVAAWIVPERGGRVMFLDRDRVLSDDGPWILRHQMEHFRQMAISLDESPWWYEADAAWAEDPSASRIGGLKKSVAAFLRAAREGFEPDDIAAWEGAVLWPQYLMASGAGPRVITRAWDEMAAVPGNNTLVAFAAAVRSDRGATLADEVRSFRLWNLFTGNADDGNHYAFGADLPSVPIPTFRTESSALRDAESIPPFGSIATRLIASPGPGGWSIDFSGAAGAAWDVSVITLPSSLDSAPRLAEVRLDEGLKGSSAIPWHDLAGIVLVVQNLGGESHRPQRFNLTAKYDPIVPFDLLTFTADPENRSVALRWTTEDERGVAGWMIYRSQDPIRGFVPINTVQFPAAGGAESASYMFLDADVRPGRKYYYLLEGVTREGFSEPTHVTAAHVPEASGESEIP